MKSISQATGIVAEYNPFHNGHQYHVAKTRAMFAAPIVAVMSGNFVQRGEPALMDKQLRAKAAVQNGVDLVLELPAVFATCSAEHFAAGAVRLLDSLGIIGQICCGAEDDQLLQSVTAGAAIDSIKLKTVLKTGMSYANALAEISELPEQLQPNNILAIEYQRAIHKYNCALQLHTIKRIANRYHDYNPTGNISSATAIRAMLTDTGAKTADWQQQLPATSALDVEQYLKTKNLCRLADYWQILAYRLHTLNATEIADGYEISEGLENRFIESVKTSASVAELLASVKSKRYTYTRLNRFLIHLLLGIKRRDLQEFRDSGPQYVRPLAWTATGEQLIKTIASKSPLPIITRPSKFLKSAPRSLAATMLGYDITATKIHSIVSNIDPLGDFHNMPFIVK